MYSSSAYSASAAFTPAANSHTAGDSVGAATEFVFSNMVGSKPSTGAALMITSASLMIADATAAVTAWRLYLFNVTPPSALADDAAFVLAAGDRASYLGYVDIGTAVDLGSTQWVETHAINKQLKLSGNSVFGYLVNLTTLTPAAVAHTVTLHVVS
jgi:hypothetical protein